MEHLALYRKYRPKNFDEIVGQDNIISTLKRQVEKNEISHAYLFFGTRGTGKTSTAKILAKAINCQNPVNGSPCLKCEVCKSLEDPSNLDILEIDAASNNRVDEIRDLKDKIKYPPVNGKYKVYIIDEVHMLTDSAFNALLKTLEEPPSHAVFILATTEAHKLPATILSRVMRFDFKLVTMEVLARLVKNIFDKENITYDEESIKAICSRGEGSVRDTLSVADVCASFSGKNITYNKVLDALGVTSTQTLENLANSIITKNASSLLKDIHNLYNAGKNFSVLTNDLIIYFRNLLLIKNIDNANEILHLPEEIFNSMKAQSKIINEKSLLSYMNLFNEMQAELKYTKNERILFETTALLCVYQQSQIDLLLERVDNLEKEVKSVFPKKFEASKLNELAKTSKLKLGENALKTATLKQSSDINALKQAETKNKVFNLKKLWAEFLISVNAQTHPVLYTAVVDAMPKEVNGSKLILEANTEIVKNTLEKPDNKNKIVEFLKQKQINLMPEIIVKKIKQNNKNIEVLQEKFGKILKIEE